ncbi:glycosyltransferase family 87 protein [Azospirillum thermophilum]|uniref:DUF2029 domain-containing protein n=1 Tax=Azospirillum thermophilum TaxID=2202148 RepID=A0A2S2CXJ6_9PROT|nr:glycosyltransferase family 87 protein [Azospirillum thermophilum]AWK89130.1 hypothetical protein DEW08_24345 [Azospirillum thermophilum]
MSTTPSAAEVPLARTPAEPGRLLQAPPGAIFLDPPCFGLGARLWAVATLVVAVIAVVQPHRCIAWVYRAAAEAWVAAAPLYAPGLHGFLYLPSGTLVYLPFALLPQPFDSHLWRLFLSGALYLAVLRLARQIVPRTGTAASGMILALAIPAATIDLLRGQMTLLMLALLLASTAEIAAGRETRGGVLLAVAVIVKPLALVPGLLFAAAVPGTRRGFVAGLLLGIAAGLMHPQPDYAVAQWLAMVGKLGVAAAPDSGTWFDLGALLKKLGLIEPAETLFGWRLGAAVLTLAAALVAVRRLDRVSAAVAVLHLGCCYLLLWNPRVEEGSFVMLAVLAGGLAAVAAWTPGGGRRCLLFAGLCLALGTHMYGDWIYRPTAFWLKQAVTLVHLGLLLDMIRRRTPLVLRREA